MYIYSVSVSHFYLKIWNAKISQKIFFSACVEIFNNKGFNKTHKINMIKKDLKSYKIQTKIIKEYKDNKMYKKNNNIASLLIEYGTYCCVIRKKRDK